MSEMAIFFLSDCKDLSTVTLLFKEKPCSLASLGVISHLTSDPRAAPGSLGTCASAVPSRPHPPGFACGSLSVCPPAPPSLSPTLLLLLLLLSLFFSSNLPLAHPASLLLHLEDLPSSRGSAQSAPCEQGSRHPRSAKVAAAQAGRRDPPAPRSRGRPGRVPGSPHPCVLLEASLLRETTLTGNAAQTPGGCCGRPGAVMKCGVSGSDYR